MDGCQLTLSCRPYLLHIHLFTLPSSATPTLSKFATCLQVLVDLATPSSLMDSLRAAAEGVIKANPNEFNGTLSVNLNSGTNPLKMTVAVGLLHVLLCYVGAAHHLHVPVSYVHAAAAGGIVVGPAHPCLSGCLPCLPGCLPCLPSLPALPCRSIGNTVTAGQTVAALGARAHGCTPRFQRQWPRPAPGVWAAVAGAAHAACHL